VGINADWNIQGSNEERRQGLLPPLSNKVRPSNLNFNGTNMNFTRQFKIIYRAAFDTATLPIDKTQKEFDCFADNVGAARKRFQEVNPNAWIITVVPI
jgi:hypothetical protein